MCSPCHAALNSILAEIAGLCQGVVIKKNQLLFWKEMWYLFYHCSIAKTRFFKAGM